MVDPQSQVTLSRSKALRDLGLSRLHFQDAHPDAHGSFLDILESYNVSDARSTRRSPCSRTSNITFDTFRANASGSLDFSPGQISESPSNLVPPFTSPPIAVAQLGCLLGNTDGKLKIGASLQPHHPDRSSRSDANRPTSPKRPDNLTTLERAKVRPRVELDIQLASETFVQGQFISGQLVVHVRGHKKAKNPVLLANNTLRIIGFEYLTDRPTFHVFFHFSRKFDDISYASEKIFSECPDYCDEEGYREAKEGLHVLPFEMELPIDSRFGKPKGVIDVPGGVAMRYIIMSSIDIKDPDTNRLSLAHFYRQCSIWPGLSLQELLVPSTRPLVSTAVLSVPQGGSYSKLKLAARVPRPSYFAGQSCYVHIQITNNTQRTVRSLCMTLIRTTAIYRPRSGRRSHGEITDEHKYTVKTIVDDISESRLVMADRTSRRAASSKGWWPGVNSDQKTAFTHCILVPPDALSVARSKFLAVDHAIRVTVYASTGILGLTSHLSVTLPIRIVSLLSVDPPTSVASPCDMIGAIHDQDGRRNGPSGEFRLHQSELESRTDSPPPYRTRPPSLEQPQNTTETLPRYSDAPLRQSAASIVDPALGDESPVHEGEMSLEVDSPPARLITVHSHRLPAYAVGARSTGVAQEEQQFQDGAIRSSENKVTSLDHQTGGYCVFESSVNDGARESDPDQGNDARRRHSVSPVPSPHWERERAVTVPYCSEALRREQTVERRPGQKRSRNPSSRRTHGDAKNGAGRRDFRSYESPFTQRVREKLRRVHKSGESSQGTAELPASIEVPDLNCEEEITLTPRGEIGEHQFA